MNTLQVPQGQFTLSRYPDAKDATLRAWDAADEYILLSLHEQPHTASYQVVFNDTFGALSVALSASKPELKLYSISDSFISQQGLIENLKQNKIDSNLVTIQDSLALLPTPLDHVIIKIPKSLATLEDILYRVREQAHEGTQILASGMNKHIHTSTLNLFERIIGPTHSSLARKKARLIHSQFDANLKPGTSPYPSRYTLEKTGDEYANHANVFCREKLDLGSRFMLEHIPQSPRYQNIVDLACGNGILGIAAAERNPHARIGFVDESYMAVASAKMNALKLISPSNNHPEQLYFNVTDCLQGIEDNSLDLIINNPPFHQNHVVGDFIAWQMFKDAKEKLKTGGEIHIVGNRHLGYHIKLKKLFGRCEMIASNKKFVILKAVKQ